MVNRLQSTTLYSNERIALDIPARICAQLLRQAGDTAKPNGHYAVDRALNVTTLAQRIHANRETVSRTIWALITKGMMIKQGRQFIIIDKAAVARRAEGE